MRFFHLIDALVCLEKQQQLESRKKHGYECCHFDPVRDLMNGSACVTEPTSRTWLRLEEVKQMNTRICCITALQTKWCIYLFLFSFVLFCFLFFGGQGGGVGWLVVWLFFSLFHTLESEFGGLWKHQSNPACTKSVKVFILLELDTIRKMKKIVLNLAFCPTTTDSAHY